MCSTFEWNRSQLYQCKMRMLQNNISPEAAHFCIHYWRHVLTTFLHSADPHNLQYTHNIHDSTNIRLVKFSISAWCRKLAHSSKVEVQAWEGKTSKRSLADKNQPTPFIESSRQMVLDGVDIHKTNKIPPLSFTAPVKDISHFLFLLYTFSVLLVQTNIL